MINILRSFLFDKTSTTISEVELEQLNQHDIPDLHNSCESFYSCHSVMDVPQENKTFPTEEQIRPADSLLNRNYNMNGERRKMNANNDDHHHHHHHHEVVINSDHNHSKASIMQIDRSKYIYHDGEFLPIDYILVYTRYHSSHFRRSHKFRRQHDQYRQYFQDRLRRLGFIVVEERLTDEENDLLNLRQAEASPDVHDNNNNNNDESNHVWVRGFSTLQRHVSIRLQNISSHLKKDTNENNNNNTNGTQIDKIDEEETVQLNNAIDNIRYENESKVC
ncbi:unnamed protein product [Rotaria sordida]|uniref:Uncharacterized protein n=1 Tax=Rotaria sordida TaxID=392033 RepID=A0A815DG70_9BILA|nr:unnamed protein product [Rotaria sordida]